MSVNNHDDEKNRREAFFEYAKTTNELYKERKKKFLIVSTGIIFIVLFIKIFFGTLEIYNIFGYPSSNARYYKVTVNDEQVAVSYVLRKRFPLIPYLINLNSTYLGNSYIKNTDNEQYYVNDSDKYIIDFESYNCYYNDVQIECKYNDQTMKKNNDEKPTKMIITRITNPHEEVYNGTYIEDITSYIREKGQYCIQIITKHGLVTSEVYFYFNNLKREN